MIAREVDARRRHQGGQPGHKVERLDKIAGSDFEQPKVGPKGEGQDAWSSTTSVVPSRYGGLETVANIPLGCERQAFSRDRRARDVAAQALQNAVHCILELMPCIFKCGVERC